MMAVPLVCWAPSSGDGELCPVEQVQTDLQPPVVKECPRQKIQVSHHGVESHTSTCFSTDLSSSSLQRVAPSPKNPCNSTRRGMMATSIEWTATSALTCGEGDGKVQTSKEEHTERLRVKPRETVGWQNSEGATKTTDPFVTSSMPSPGWSEWATRFVATN